MAPAVAFLLVSTRMWSAGQPLRSSASRTSMASPAAPTLERAPGVVLVDADHDRPLLAAVAGRPGPGRQERACRQGERRQARDPPHSAHRPDTFPEAGWPMPAQGRPTPPRPPIPARCSSASSRTWRTSSTRWNVMASRTASGTSSRSAPLRAGRMTSREPGPVGGQHLLLDAADRQHPALQRDLAGHADARPHRPAGEQADQRGGHGDAGRRAVLGHGAGGDVHVEAARRARRRRCRGRRRASARRTGRSGPTPS